MHARTGRARACPRPRGYRGFAAPPAPSPGTRAEPGGTRGRGEPGVAGGTRGRVLTWNFAGEPGVGGNPGSGGTRGRVLTWNFGLASVPGDAIPLFPLRLTFDPKFQVKT